MSGGVTNLSLGSRCMAPVNRVQIGIIQLSPPQPMTKPGPEDS